MNSETTANVSQSLPKEHIYNDINVAILKANILPES